MLKRAFATPRGAVQCARHGRRGTPVMASLVIVLAVAVCACDLRASQPAGTSAMAGRIVEFSVLPVGAANNLEGITAGPDGNLWVTYVNIDTRTDVSDPPGGIARITPAGSVTIFPLPNSTGRFLGLGGIVAGPDGALWFTQTAFVGQTGRIERITTAGVITAFPLPAYSNPTAIATGPDGALWFTDPGRSKIGRITTAGVVTEFGLVTVGSSPMSIDAGPDGALWFTQSWGGTAESLGGKIAIGRITTVGTVTEFPSGVSPGYSPGTIAAGRDGNLWFVEETPSGNGLIGRITPTGSVTTFAIPTARCSPRGIITGSDGALWFTEEDGNKIGRITAAGAMTEYPLPTTARRPWSIAAGPDGALWFTELQTGKIGRIPA